MGLTKKKRSDRNSSRGCHARFGHGRYARRRNAGVGVYARTV